MSLRHILLITPNPPHTGGGIDQYVRDFVCAVNDSFSQCTLHQHSRTKTRHTQPSKHHIVYTSQGSVLDLIRRCTFSAYRVHPDIIVCAHINLLPAGVLAAKVSSCPLILFAYGIDIWSEPSKWQRALLKRVTKVVTISRYTRGKITQRFGILGSKISLLPNCLHPPSSVSDQSRVTFSRRFRLGDKKIILTVARMSRKERYKGHEKVMHVLVQLKKDIPNVTYLIVGGGDDIDYLQSRAKELGLAEDVIFTGFVDPADRAAAYAVADCFVMPSAAEGFGFVYLEARSYGLPVVGIDAAGARDSLVNGELGTLVEPEDDTALMHSVRSALNKPKSTYQGLTRFSYTRFEQHAARILIDVMNQSDRKRLSDSASRDSLVPIYEQRRKVTPGRSRYYLDE